MKKIKAKIINEYNRYLISTKNSIRKQLRSLQFSLLKEFSRFSSLTRKTFFYFVRLKFMKNSKVRISVFNRYLILLIVILFSSLFYLSTPSLYNYVTLQKELTEKLLKEFPQNTRVIPNTYGLLMTDEKYVDKEIPKDLKAWDTIIGINNTLINNGVEFSDELINHHIGSRIDVSIIRNKRFLRIKDIIVKVLHVDANKMYDAELRR